MYDGDAVTITSTGGVPDAPGASLLRGQSTTTYDELGRAYRSDVYSVDPSSGSVGAYTLHLNSWFDKRGQVVKSSSPRGLVQKVAYDGVGRTTVSSTTDGGGDTVWSDAFTVTGDTVLSQNEITYDTSGLALLTTSRQRFHDETGTGVLGTPTTGVKARVSYAANYYDAGDRPLHGVFVGTNGGTAYTRPSTVPSRSDTVLVNSTEYDSAGRAFKSIDPKGLENRTVFDAIGRTLKTVANYVDGTVSDTDDKTTEYTYGSSGMTNLTAKLTGGGGQTTEWVYGVSTTTGSGINSNDVVGKTKWPDPSTGNSSSSQQEAVLVNALGQPLVTTDRNGNSHTLSYDILGRVVSDAITTLGSGVDGSVRRVESAYDSQGNAYLLTNYDAASGGNIVTQVQRQFNGLGQLTTEYQSHSGAVNTSTTPKVQYAYSEMAGGANHSRLMSMTYPSGYVVTYNYSIGLNGNISRLSSLSDSSGTLESYDYLGLGTVVRRSHPQPAVDLTFLGTGPGSGGDQYVGLDSFNRVIDQNWKKGTFSTDRFTYSYDRDGNRLTKGNSVNTAFNESYGYDNLNQLSSFTRGSHTQSWNFDSLGNWNSVTTDGSTQTRSHNKQNEITSVSGATTPTFDTNGNMTKDETGKQYVYDAWNRIKIVKDSGGTTLKTYGYDAMNRRVSETVGSNTTDLYYSAGWQVLEERVNGNGKYRYVWSPVYVDAMILRDRLDASERIWVKQDANFNVTAITDNSGAVLERYAYDSYGKVTVLNASWTAISGSAYDWVYLHQGGRLDAVSGLYHFRNRDHSAALGRWVTMDPIRYNGLDNNLYRYMSSGPLNYTDSLGLFGGPPPQDWIKSQTEPPGAHGAVSRQAETFRSYGAEWEYAGNIWRHFIDGTGAGHITNKNTAPELTKSIKSSLVDVIASMIRKYGSGLPCPPKVGDKITEINKDIAFSNNDSMFGVAYGLLGVVGGEDVYSVPALFYALGGANIKINAEVAEVKSYSRRGKTRYEYKLDYNVIITDRFTYLNRSAIRDTSELYRYNSYLEKKGIAKAFDIRIEYSGRYNFGWFKKDCDC